MPIPNSEHGIRQMIVDAIDDGRLIQEQPPGRCGLCGGVQETRPYGPNGEEVCFPCGMKNEAAAERAFAAKLGPALSTQQTPEER